MKHLLLLLCLCNVTMAQTIKGTVFDNTTKEPIPFASVGIKGKTMGTVSDESGNFELMAKNAIDTDSLKVSAIGYQSKCFTVAKAKNFNGEKILLLQTGIQLAEVVVKPTKTITKILGNKNYNTNISCAFQGYDNNYLGVEAAIRANSKKGRLIWIEKFSSNLNKCTLKDSATFRLNFYKVNKDGMPGENILQKPVIFKIAPQIGPFTVDLKKYNINTNDDFFISLECLSSTVTDQTLAFSGSLIGPSYLKMATFFDWEKLAVMGLDFNVTVTYQK
jgi:hypothetical protein